MKSANGIDRAQVLKARARALARPPARGGGVGPAIQAVEFRLAHERYAIEQKYAREAVPFTELTPLPGTPAFLLGIVNVRGQILPVIDVKKFFDLPQSGITDLHTILIVQAGEVELGILADAVIGVRSIAIQDVQPSLPTLSGIRSDYLKGVTADSLVILDVHKILTDPKIVVNEEVQTQGEA